jgi:hypothetical protein
MEVGLCLRLSKVFNIICHLIDVALDNLNIVHEHIHGPLVGGHPHLLLAVNVVELGISVSPIIWSLRTWNLSA